MLYNFYEYWLNDSLSKTRGSGVVKEVLKHLCREDTPPRVSDLARKMGKRPEEVHNALRMLDSVDVLYRQEGSYHFCHLPFKFFLRYKFSDMELYEYNKNQYYEKQVDDLREKFYRVSTELGKSKETEFYYTVSSHQGKMLWGIKIPKFKDLCKNHIERGNEIDLAGWTLRGKLWAFEIKWKGKAAGVKEVKAFLGKLSAYRYVYISKTGFTDRAIEEFDRDNRVFLVKPGRQV
ncbi:MAG: restriction endonuclease [Fibrobacteria bacterium]|nr:restriction endonuclease [Fibrobacteria bacterium]